MAVFLRPLVEVRLVSLGKVVRSNRTRSIPFCADFQMRSQKLRSDRERCNDEEDDMLALLVCSGSDVAVAAGGFPLSN